MKCPLFELEPQLTTNDLQARARRTMATALTPTSRARLQRLAAHPNADPNLRETIASRLYPVRR